MTISRAALLGSFLLTLAPVAAPHAQTLPFRLAHAGRPLKVSFMFSIEPDCRSRGRTAIVVIVPPANGTVSTQEAMGFPNVVPTDSAVACNRRRVAGTNIFYTASRGYAGSDTFTVQSQFPNGIVRNTKYDIVVQ